MAFPSVAGSEDAYIALKTPPYADGAPSPGRESADSNRRSRDIAPTNRSFDEKRNTSTNSVENEYYREDTSRSRRPSGPSTPKKRNCSFGKPTAEKLLAISFFACLGVLSRVGLTELTNEIGDDGESFITDLGSSYFLPNIIGTFIMGTISRQQVWSSSRYPALTAGLGTGFCGCLTTFATWDSSVAEEWVNGQWANALILMLLLFSSVMSAWAIGYHLSDCITQLWYKDIGEAIAKADYPSYLAKLYRQRQHLRLLENAANGISNLSVKPVSTQQQEAEDDDLLTRVGIEDLGTSPGRGEGKTNCNIVVASANSAKGTSTEVTDIGEGPADKRKSLQKAPEEGLGIEDREKYKFDLDQVEGNDIASFLTHFRVLEDTLEKHRERYQMLQEGYQAIIQSSTDYAPAPKTSTMTFILTLGFFLVFYVMLWVGAVLDNNTTRAKYWTGAVFAPFGALCRYELAIMLNSRLSNFPLGTFVANIVASCGTSILAVVGDTVDGSTYAQWALAGLSTGFMGSLSTVSTWVNETQLLARLDVPHAYVYAGATAIVGQVLAIVIHGAYEWTR